MASEKRDNWRETAHRRLDEMLNNLEAELPEDASLASIEQALILYEKEFLTSTFQLLAERQELSPPKEEQAA
jgi:hypothetical protein